MQRHKVLCPSLLADQKNTCLSRLEKALEIFQEKQWLSGSLCDLVLKEFKNLCPKPDVILSRKAYDKENERLDHFWRSLIAAHKGSDALWNFLKKVFILSQGNAFVERGFSINKEIIVKNQRN